MIDKLNPQQRLVAFTLASFPFFSLLGVFAAGLTTKRAIAQVPSLPPPPEQSPSPQEPLPLQPAQEEQLLQTPPQTFGPANPPPSRLAPPPFEDPLVDQFRVYRLDVGDAVSVSVPEFPEFNFQSVVDEDGNVIVPFLGRVSVVGLTLEEVETKIRFELTRRFLQVEPQVIAVLAGVRPVRITVIGEVVRPGYYTLGPGSDLTAVLNAAGGSTEQADLREIVVRRPLVDGSAIEETVDVYTPLQNGERLPRIRLQGGDTVIISRLEVGSEEDYDSVLVSRTTLPQQQITVRVLVPAGTGTTLRNLNLQNGSTFLDVVAALPSGDAVFLDRDEIGLVRFDPERGQVVTQTLDAEAAIEGDVAQNVPLRDEDVIVVGRSLLGEVLNVFNVLTQPVRSFFGFRSIFNTFD